MAAAFEIMVGRVEVIGGERLYPLVMPALGAGTYDFVLRFSRSRGWQAQGLP